jgi:hypothetical protein
MMGVRSHPGIVRVAALTVLTFLCPLVVGGFMHTDDGCVVERHCQVCVFALHDADGIIESSVPLTLPLTAEISLPVRHARVSQGEADLVTSRGPPAV